ncbi:hypothetical protein RHGRI_027493 [Rhododendron griersonianum]|uniref:DUF674 family protein n=1 Tax=Rhododendron griersonianum TaxID=479676 RepID=A0AAV6IXM9_9ERIC|nr:hypothetical protein RHGRI_027493 [Rhododendron griersonianum]
MASSSSSKEVITLKLLVDTKNNRVLFADAGNDFIDFLFTLLSLPIGTIVRLLTAKSMVGCLGNLYDSVDNLSDTYMQSNQNKEVANTGLSGEGGYVKGVITYMVMDDLVVMPMSSISGIALLSKFNVTNGLKLLKETLHSKMVLTSVFLGGMKTIDASSSIPRDPVTDASSFIPRDPVTVGETGPTTDASASTSKAMSEPPPNEAVASSEPNSKEFHERVEECFNITFCHQDNIIKEQKRIRKRVDYFVTKLEEQFGATYISEGEEEDANYVPHDINIIS